MDNVLRKIILSSCLFLLISSTSSYSQEGYKTIVKLTDLSDVTLLNKMESNATELLTGINEACVENRKPEIKTDVITEYARQILSSLWATSPIRCTETQIIQRVLQMKRENKYQVRNIPVFVKDVFSENGTNSKVSDTTNHHDYEICLTFNSAGVIENIFYSLELNSYLRLLNESVTVTELSRREFILEFLENFRTAYNRKDIDFLDKVYSNDALIIIGTEIKSEHSDMLNQLGEKIVVYQTQRKKEYIETLKNRIFKNNRYVNVIFDEIKIVKDLEYPDIYGVTLKQYWNTSGYKDVGYLFLMIDFKDEANPMIHVRTWQPEAAKQTKEGIFGLNSFKILR